MTNNYNKNKSTVAKNKKTTTRSRNTNNKLTVPGSESAIDQMKYEIANEMGVNLGPDATSRENGNVGGEITKRLVEMAQNKIK